MGVSVKYQVHTRGWRRRRNVHQVDAQAHAIEIKCEWPVSSGVAISANHLERFAPCPQFVQNPLPADIAQMPDLVRAGNALYELERQFVMRIRDNCDSGRFLSQV